MILRSCRSNWKGTNADRNSGTSKHWMIVPWSCCRCSGRRSLRLETSQCRLHLYKPDGIKLLIWESCNCRFSGMNHWSLFVLDGWCLVGARRLCFKLPNVDFLNRKIPVTGEDLDMWSADILYFVWEHGNNNKKIRGFQEDGCRGARKTCLSTHRGTFTTIASRSTGRLSQWKKEICTSGRRHEFYPLQLRQRIPQNAGINSRHREPNRSRRWTSHQK